ncbi:MAG: ribosome-associated translation inhibitor RaiA [Chloroflexi bacterium]|nr:ribosome-associated translation inhibitor RaiA [Chloroflexota bacterium]
MKTNLTARNLELTDRLRGEVEHKLARLDRIAHRDAEANVALIANASHSSESAHVAEVTLITNGHVLRSTAAGPTPLAAIDTVLDRLERQAVRAKERPRSVRGRHSDEVSTALAAEAVKTLSPDDPGGRSSVVKIKRFDMLPMFEEDAISQMEELGHAFFLFLNAETDAVAVLYRRRDGAYGLIEPVIGDGRSR